jgi:hypothetical protein
MALQSPGVQVTVIDESFYTPAEPGTTPLIVVATGQDKLNGAGTNTASGTLKGNAGKAFKLTSQRDLTDLFGVPFFEKTASSSPIHGSERNEYGLLAAYSLLGVSNAAFIMRADIDLNQLSAQAAAPGADPVDGQWWVDTQATTWGIQEWNAGAISTTGGQKFATKTPIVLTDNDSSKLTSGVPKTSVGSIGDYAVVFETVDGTGTFTASKENAKVYYKSAGNTAAGIAAGAWVLVGSNDWAVSHPTVIGGAYNSPTTGETFLINGTTVTVGGTTTLDALVANINNLRINGDLDGDKSTGVFAQNVGDKLYLYTNASNDITGDSSLSNAIVIAAGTITLSTIGLTAGTYYGPAIQQTPHTQVPEWKVEDKTEAPLTVSKRPSGSVWVKTTEPNEGARWRVKSWNAATETWVATESPIYATTTAALYYLDRTGGGANIASNSLFVQTNAEENTLYDTTPPTVTFRMWRRAAVGATTITANIAAGTVGSTGTKTFTLAESVKTSADIAAAKTISFTAANTKADADAIAAAINAAGFTNIIASAVEVNSTTSTLTISHKLGGDFRITDTSLIIANIFDTFDIDTQVGTANFYALPTAAAEDFIASNWQPFAAANFKASSDAPLNTPADGQLWYNSEVNEVDIMIHNGTTWVGYRNSGSQFAEAATTSPRLGYTPIVTASNPYVNGITATGDLWISTADLENYPTIYRYNSALTNISAAKDRWELVDKTDQVTEEGVLFADARYGLSGADGDVAGSIVDLANINFLDFDAPDPALYPKGMLLWNLRRSSGNVKVFRSGYVDTSTDNPRFNNNENMSLYAADRWVTASPNNEDGSGAFLRQAQRGAVVAALKSAVDTSSEIRDEERRNFNLIACPGYPELMSNLVNLNIDRGITAFVVGDTPLRLAADATTLTNWGTNAELVTDNGDKGIVTYDEYLGVFYPSGFTTDLSGTNAVVPSSHMMLRTIALSDNVSYPWFAPAGTRRGGITNATAVGYIDGTSGEFQTVALNEGQRDTLYDLKVNPITFFNGVGLINFGQKTRARNASALDRINVARLTVYLRSQLNKLARPYIFEPNDKITRDEIRQSVESLLLELVGLRAIYDFAVVCDESNNTPARIDRNELWLDIAIEPVKAVEFIYIPLRVKNTGEI